jgi:hypothetical protein
MLFVPGSHLNIPPGGKLLEQSVIHGVIFAILNYLVYKYVRPLLENFDNPNTRAEQPCPVGYTKCPSGECRLKSDIHSPCS